MDINTIQGMNFSNEMKSLEDCMEKNSKYYAESAVRLSDEVHYVHLTYENIEDAIEDAITIAKEAQDMTRQVGSVCEEEGRVKTEAEAARGRMEVQLKEARGAREREEKSNIQLEAMREKLAKRGDLAIVKKDESIAELENYKRALGLDFVSSTRAGVVVVFSNIDKQDPDRKFFFHLAIQQERNTYTVADCLPPLDDMQKLVNMLNQNQDLSGFLGKIRLKFRQSLG